MHTYQHACSQPGLGHGNRNGNARGVAGNESLQRQLQRQRRQWRPLDTCLSTLAHTHTCMHTSTFAISGGSYGCNCRCRRVAAAAWLLRSLSDQLESWPKCCQIIFTSTHTYVHLCMCMCVLCQLACIEKLVECVVEKRP